MIEKTYDYQFDYDKMTLRELEITLEVAKNFKSRALDHALKLRHVEDLLLDAIEKRKKSKKKLDLEDLYLHECSACKRRINVKKVVQEAESRIKEYY
jgi:uncharacterized protein YajQ (UPF0234 family)